MPLGGWRRKFGGNHRRRNLRLVETKSKPVVSATVEITQAASNILLGADWQDSTEACVRTQIREFIEEILEVELSKALGRRRYDDDERARPVSAEQFLAQTETLPLTVGGTQEESGRKPAGRTRPPRARSRYQQCVAIGRKQT